MLRAIREKKNEEHLKYFLGAKSGGKENGEQKQEKRNQKSRR